MNKNVILSTSIGLLFLIFFAVNGIGDKLLSRFYADLTDEGLYTLSKGSKSLISKLNNPVTLKFYYSKSEGDNLPIIKLYGARVADLLREYERVSGEKVSVEIVDPKPDSEEEEWAEKYGLSPMNLPTGQKLFLGLVAINGEGQEASIPVFDVRRQEYLEYDITKLIYSLDAKQQPVIGVLSSLQLVGDGAAMPPMFAQQQPRKSWIVINQLKKLFDVKVLPQEIDSIPQEVNVLFIVHPRGFSQKLQYAIDQYVMRGGNLVLAVDPFAMVDAPQQDPSNPMANFTHDRSSNLNDLTTKWGFKLSQGKVVTDRYLATPVNTNKGRPENFIAWLSILGNSNSNKGQALVTDDVVTNNLENIMFAWAGAFEKVNAETEGLKESILIQTTPDAMLMEEKDIRFSAENPDVLLDKHTPSGKQEILSLKLSGIFKSNFEKSPEGVTNSSHLTKGEKNATILAFSDVDFIADDYSAMSQNLFGTELVSFLNDNQTLALNALDNLTGNADLIALRSRGRFTRPFSKVQMIEAEAQDRYKDVEKSFQSALNQANDRLSKLQSGIGGDGKKAVMSDALLQEIQKLREDKRTAQRQLREVRLALRQDKESLGSVLFVLNTFFVPLILVGFYLFKNFRSKQKA